MTTRTLTAHACYLLPTHLGWEAQPLGACPSYLAPTMHSFSYASPPHPRLRPHASSHCRPSAGRTLTPSKLRTAPACPQSHSSRRRAAAGNASEASVELRVSSEADRMRALT